VSASRRVSWRSVVALGLLLLALRGTCYALFDVIMRYNQLLSVFGLWSTARLALGFVLVRWLADRARAESADAAQWARSWRLVAAVALLGLVGREQYLEWTGIIPHRDYVERLVGSYPYRGGVPLQEAVGVGHETRTLTLPEGHRTCGPQPAEGRRVALIGDSFVFGKGLADDATLCVRLSAAAAERHPGVFSWINLGQEGASLGSYDETLRFAAQAHGAQGAIIGVLLPDDGLPFDVNHRDRVLRESWLLRFAVALFDRGTVLTVLAPICELSAADFVSQRVLVQGLDQVAATAAELKVPVKLYFYGHPWLSNTFYEQHAARLASENPWFETLGSLTPPEVEVARIAGDGHPSEAGNRWYAAQLLEQLGPWVSP
jgi:hypothetical protein